jgi:amino acid adenylation domain-containing protein
MTLSKQELFSEVERHRLLAEWSRSTSAPVPDIAVHELFELQAQKTPDAVAVMFESESWTYGEVNARSNRLAHHLRAQGVGPETLVGISVERGLDMVVGLLGILKAGGAYVPIDPAYPKDRIETLIKDSQLSAWVTHEKLLAQLPNTHALVVCLDRDERNWANRPESSPRSGVKGHHLAYVIYTSGSTGKPKGVMIEHHSLTSYITGVAKRYGLSERDRVFQFASISFDVAGEEIYAALISGARLIVRSERTSLDPSSLAKKFGEWGITKAELPTAYWHQFTSELAESSLPLPPSLRVMVIGGEAAKLESVLTWQKHWGSTGPLLVNAYGPTEATIGATSYEFVAPWNAELTSVPIGRPFPNTRVYVLDGDGEPVPTGVAGELYIGGEHVGRGYLNCPELTAERFIQDPFSSDSGARLYRTGDLVRWSPDANLEYLGRIDDQVKIRGFRIELGEIESRLAEHPQVREALVLAREDRTGDKRLVAYVVPRAGEAPEGSEMQRHLAALLPAYMVPVAFVVLGQFPLTTHGKVDREALPLPDYGTSHNAHVAPRNALEETVARLVAEVLGLGQVSVADNFFDLGGHSLLATQLIARIRRTLQVELSPTAVFTAPTVVDLSALIKSEAQVLSRPPLVHQPGMSTLPMSFSQQRLWFLDRLEGGRSATYNAPDAWWLQGSLDIPALTSALNEVVRRHEALRTRLVDDGDTCVQVIDPPRPLVFPVVDVADEAQALRHLERAAVQAFSLATEWPLRVQLLKLNPEKHMLILAYHHIATDGWSLGVLANEVTALYRSFRNGEPPTLSELQVQYADYIMWQRSWLQGDLLDQQLAYWRGKLTGAPVLALPTDRPRPAVSSYRGGMIPVSLPERLMLELERLSRAHDVTLSMTLTAAFALLLGRLSGQEEVVVGTPVANRTQLETEALIGFFANTLALRINLRGDLDLASFLREVRDVALEAYAHQDIPFEQVVETLAPERTASHNPLFQALIAVHQPIGQLELQEVEVEYVPSATHTAKFDVELALRREPGGLRGTLEYSTDLFDADTMARLVDRFETLLVGLVQANAAQAIATLPLLSETERQQVQLRFNDTAVSYPKDECVHQLFEEQARKAPDSVALAFGTSALTYAELNAKANRLAHFLREKGVGPEVLVGIAAERSIEMVVGLFAVLKAGGAYVPIDPAYPSDRIEYMLKDSKVEILLTQENLLPLLPELDPTVLCLDRDAAKWAQCPADNLDSGARADNLAYAIYTSGSTGRPKAAMNQHGAVVNRLRWMQETYGLDGADRVLQKTPFSFDVSVWEFFWPTMAGAVLVVAKPEGHKDSAYLADLIARERITTVHFVPSMLQAFLDEPLAAGCAPLRRVICSGEALPYELCRRFFAIFEAVELHNLYGPTECAVDVTALRCVRECLANPVPIGKPIANTKIYILGSGGQLAPIGVAGELHIGGIQVGRGYLNRPELTAEKFIRDPFSDEAQARLYKTGDLARWLSNGTIEYLGRMDFQVKIRGFRIELGEIESRLAEHPQVREALVLAREDRPGNKRLVAYVTPQRDQAASEEGDSSAEKVASWQAVYESTYTDLSGAEEGLFSGWVSSYDGKAIAIDEMREWQASTVERILALRPRRVLEIGVGTGLLLHEIAPHCESYYGTDFSEKAVEYVRRKLAKHAEYRDRVHLSRRAAHELTDMPENAFDVVVVNSVIQYFPSAGYLTRVLRQAAALLGPGGAIFVGDVRNLQLHRQFRAAIQVKKAPESIDLPLLCRHLEQSLISESELLVDPNFFVAFAAEEAKFRGADIQIRRGRAHNELTRYRYDAILRTSSSASSMGEVAADPWTVGATDLSALKEKLETERPASLRVVGIPNARLSAEAAVWKGLERGEHVTRLKERLESHASAALDPERFYELGEELGYRVLLTWSGGGPAGSIDAIFWDSGRDSAGQCTRELAETVDTYRPKVFPSRHLESYANTPDSKQAQNNLVQNLRAHLGTVLPEYMVPSAFVVLGAMPLNGSGKVDRKALPSPDYTPAHEESCVAARTRTEAALVELVLAVLGLEQVSVTDNFFELGGHSLLATQLVSRIRRALDVDLPLRELFSTPVLADLAARIDELKPASLEDLPAAIPLLARGAPLPASFAQERLWFIDQLETQTSGRASKVYLMSEAFEIEGRLDRACLQRALQALVDRHETLRTSLISAAGQAMQVIAPEWTLDVPLVDLSVYPEAERKGALARRLKDFAETGFDLSQGPLFRVQLAQLAKEPAEELHILMMTMHHSISDGWSMGVFMRELGELYAAFLSDQPDPLPALSVQYADYASWQRSAERTGLLAEQLEYWKNQLADLPALTLPFDRSRPAVETFAGGSHAIRLSAELTDALKALSRSREATLFMTLGAAFSILLRRFSNQEDIGFGVPIASRTRHDIENLIGFFVNTLVLRTKFEADLSFSDLLAQFKQTCLSAYANQDVPFEQLVSALNPVRSLSHSPLFQVMFQLQNNGDQSLRLGDSRVTPVECTAAVSQFDLSLDLQEKNGELYGVFEFNTDLFEPATVERLAEHFERLLIDIVSNPETSTSTLALLGEAERQQLLNEWSGSPSVPVPDLAVHELFELQAERTPDAVAVVFEGESWTYGDVSARSNRLAHHLRGKGVGPETLVAISVDRGLGMIVGLLGILKAGGAYVPIDPAYPRDRIETVIADSQVAVWVTQERFLPHLPSAPALVVCLDRDESEWANQPESSPKSGVKGHHLAYVIYTSGSTGKPKGVMIEHHSLTSYITGVAERYALSERDRVFQFASISFDVAGEEIYTALISGARLILRSERTSLDPSTLVKKFAEWGITKAELPTAYWHQFTSELAELSLPLPGTLRVLVIGGEAAKVESVLKWQEHWGVTGPLLVNAYGPTEATIGATSYEVSALRNAEQTSVPIGRPFANTRVYILDGEGQPVPRGVRGELCIGGEHVARGYWNRRELTAAKFIRDPFSSHAGARLYKTGDVARWLSDGNLEYLGRVDDQVKIRGFRIELGEIESRLSAHPQVREALVLAREERPGEKRLVAYVTPRRDQVAAEQSGRTEEHVATWRSLHETSYTGLSSGEEGSFSGWDSSYDGKAIAIEEMREWQSVTVQRILALKPKRVVEIGIGTGLLLQEIAPHCERYCGTDFSEKVVQYVRSEIAKHPEYRDRVELHNRTADDLHDIPAGAFDVVLINSVVQYFPNAEYLTRVLRQAAGLLAPGGVIFVGDVRNRQLHRQFRAAVEVLNAPASWDLAQLRRHIEQSLISESELLFDPDFFVAFAATEPQFRGVDIQVRRGWAHNELTRYRYDAILRTSSCSSSVREIPTDTWGESATDLSALRKRLERERPTSLRVVGIPNARLSSEHAALAGLERGESIAQLKERLSVAASVALDPERFYELGAELGYRVVLTWSGGGPAGRLDAIFLDRRSVPSERSTPELSELIDTYLPGVFPSQQLGSYANTPDSEQELSNLIRNLRAHLGTVLPEYMVPGAFVVLDAWPLNANGKVDRKALPSPEYHAGRDGARVAASTATEAALVALVLSVLGLDQVSVTDNFFELGGHSLLATQLVSRIRRTWDIELPLRELFSTPVLSELAARIDELKSRGVAGPGAKIPLLGRGAPLPASFAQERLWFMDQLETQTSGQASTVYLMCEAFEIKGRLKRACLGRALQALVDRHEALRTSLISVEDRVMQVIAPEWTLEVPLVDLSLHPEGEREEFLARRLEHFAETGFDLSQGPLFRVELARLAKEPEEESHVLMIKMHHSISDGWSIGVFMRELRELYEAFSSGEESPLRPLPVQYAEYASWQRSAERAALLSEQVEYWKKQLAELPVLTLPLDRPRPAVETFAGARHTFRLPADLTESLKVLSQARGATLFMTLGAAFTLLLKRYSSQDDIALGVPIASRNQHDLENVMGCFVNTLVLRTKLECELTFGELLAQFKQTCLQAYANQEVPFEHLVSALNPVRSLSHSPLFQVMFQLQNHADDELRLGDLSTKEIDVGAAVAQFELSVDLQEKDGILLGTLEFNTDLFERSTIVRLARHFEHLLASIASNPEESISALSLLNAAEREQLVNEWSRSASVPVPSVGVHELFERQAEKTPNAVAVVFEEQSWTYGDVNARSNRLARHLRGKGVRPETLVGISIERGLDMVVGLLAILKAGGAYVPIDPAYPEERIEAVLADSKVAVWVTQQEILAKLPRASALAVCLEQDEEEWGRHSGENLKSDARGHHLAYVIYTSGSTGKPKGVMIEHHSLTSYITIMAARYGLTEQDRVFQFASMSFDVAGEEIYTALISGARLILRSEQTSLEPSRLMEQFAEWGITKAEWPTAYWHQVTSELSESSLELPSSLRVLVIGGEAAKPESVWKWQERWGATGPLLVNAYGPTEATIGATSYEFEADPRAERGIVPIGRPFSNTRVYVLDQEGEPVPPGVRGELCIGGEHVARGYLNHPELTAEKFVRDPFSGDGEGRLYKTGDLVRWLSDGNLEYLGRADDQVKIRGFRIELGEIESRLAKHPQVRETLVMAREDRPGDKRLVAYVVPQGGGALDRVDFGAHLKASLPEYMVPSAFVIMDALPLTSNGKVDREALPPPEYKRAREESCVAARTETEATLVELVVSVLGAKQVSLADSFFERGGDSLLATQLVSRIRRTWKVELSLRELFSTPVLADLALRIDELRSTNAAKQGSQIPLLARGAPLPASFAQERLWFIDQLEARASGHASKVYLIPEAFKIEGRLNLAWLRRSLQALVDRHEALRTSLISVEDRTMQVIAPECTLEVPLVDLSVYSEPEREELLARRLREFAETGFDLSKGPLFRAELVQWEKQPGAEAHVLMINMHHGISDGWSMGIFMRELSESYGALSAGQGISPAALPVQYADYASWQRSAERAELLTQQLEYWKKQLAEVPVLTLPVDRPRPAVETFAGGSHTTRLSSELTKSLKELSQSCGATLFMTLGAAFSILLQRYSNQTDIAFGVPIAGRTRHDIENVIGCFVNTLVLRTNLAGELRFSELLAAFKQTCLQAHANQDVAFEHVVSALNPARSLSYSPLFQVMFQLQSNDASKGLRLGELRVTPLECPTAVSQFDLSLDMQEKDGSLSATFDFNTDLFDRSTILRLAGHFERLLASIVVRPEESVSKLSILSEEERRQLLVEFNPPANPGTPDLAVHELFARQADRTPDAVAVTFQTESMTYGALNAEANRLARYLMTQGVGPETLVGLSVERGLDMVVGLLAILKAGGAYVPLDPAYPKERLQGMLEDSRASIVLTHERLLAQLPPFAGTVVCLDRDATKWAQMAASTPDSRVTGENIAYVIYTSGSTGSPKGAMVEHRNVARLFTATEQWYRFNEKDVWTVFHSIAFDFSVWELWGALIYGGRAVVVPHLVSRSPREFLALLRSEGVTVLNQTPSAFQQLMQAEKEEDQSIAESLRYVIFGGEALAFRSLQPWFERHSSRAATLVNMYGISETTVHVTYRPIEVTDVTREDSLIGRPIPDLTLHILDPRGQLVPIGVPGELYVGGEGVARGYLNRPDLTAERFVLDPFREDPNARLYRSGDRARWLPDGDIEYLGRLDFQVKIRGFRIELGEIENRLAEHPAVRETLVMAREDGPAGRRLVAYVVPHSGQSLQGEHLREHLRSRLPEYMVPGAYVILEALPLTANGKIDRKALPSPEYRAANESHVAPRTATEAVLVGIVVGVLGLHHVSVTDNFFELGGHSLLATQLVSRVRRALNVDLPLRELFSTATLAELAGRIEALKGASVRSGLSVDGGARLQSSPLVRLQSGIAGIPPVFCIPGAGGNVSCFASLAQRLGSDTPVLGLQPPGLDGEVPPHSSVEGAAEAYVRAILALKPEHPIRLMGHSFGGWIALEMALQFEQLGVALDEVVLLDAAAPHCPGDHVYLCDGTEALLQLAETLGGSGRSALGLSRGVLSQLTADAQVDVLRQKLIEKGLVPSRTSSDAIKGMLAVFASNVNTLYCPTERLVCPAVIVRAKEQSWGEGCDSAEETMQEFVEGWQRCAPRLRVMESSGGHMTMLSGAHAIELARNLESIWGARREGTRRSGVYGQGVAPPERAA